MTTGQKTILGFVGFLIIFFVTHKGGFPGTPAHFQELTGGQKLLDLEPVSDVVGVYQRLEDIGSAGRRAYLQLLIVSDTVFPLSAFMFLFFLGKYASEMLQSGLYVRYYWILPLIFYLLI